MGAWPQEAIVKKLVLVVLALVCTTGVSSCEQFTNQLQQLNTGINDLNGGIETTSTIEVKLEDGLQEDFDDIKDQILEDIELTVAVDVANSKIYIREVLIDGVNPIVLECSVIDLGSGTAYDPNFIEPYFQERLRGIEKTNDEEVNCIKMLPVDI